MHPFRGGLLPAVKRIMFFSFTQLKIAIDENKLQNWYDFGVFLKERSQPDISELEKEFAEWEAASDEDFANVEQHLAKAK